MPLPQVNELMAYWKDHPPLHELAAAWIGYRRKPTAQVLPFAKISPTLGAVEAVPTKPNPPAPANDLGSLLSLAQRRGGEIKLDDLIWMS